MVQQLRGEELWAARMIQVAVDAPVRQHDDGSLPGMHDLDIVFPRGKIAAVEVTAAGDRAAIEQWNLMNGGGRWIVDGLQGGWMVDVRVGSSWKQLRLRLPGLLSELEASGVTSLEIAEEPRPGPEQLAAQLGVGSARQSGTDFPGSIYMNFDVPAERMGGMVAHTGDPLATWLADFLREPGQADVLKKLASSKRDARHAFIFLPGFNTAPFVVNDLLLRGDAPLPTISPQLPKPVTHVWAVSTWTSGVGLRWDPDSGWSRFDKQLDEGGTVTV